MRSSRRPSKAFVVIDDFFSLRGKLAHSFGFVRIVPIVNKLGHLLYCDLFPFTLILPLRGYYQIIKGTRQGPFRMTSELGKSQQIAPRNVLHVGQIFLQKMIYEYPFHIKVYSSSVVL